MRISIITIALTVASYNNGCQAANLRGASAPITEYEAVYKLLNSTFDGHCQVQEAVLPPAPTLTTVSCATMAGLARLTASGTTVPRPEKLVVCSSDAEDNWGCQEMTFSGQDGDLKEAAELLEPLNVFHQLTEMLKYAFDDNCSFSVGSDPVTSKEVQCNQDNLSATLVAEGASMIPTYVQVCQSNGTSMACNKAELNGASDLKTTAILLRQAANLADSED